jgi:hypothetical protein
MEPRALVIEAPKITQWGPLFRARYGAPRPYTSFILVFVIPFTKTRASFQLQLLVFDQP